MIYIKVNNELYPATVNGKIKDLDWDGRESKSITLEMSHDEVEAIMLNDVEWSIIQIDEVPEYNDQGIPTGNMTEDILEFDNSEFCISGDIIDHRDGTVTIKMGKLTEIEEAYALVFGGDL